MLAGRWIKFTLITLLLFLILGCGVEKKKNDFELGKEYFQASDYSQAMIRLEKWLSKEKNPNRIEAYAILAVIYHDYENRQAEYQNALNELKKAGEPGMAAVLKLMENKTIGERLFKTINDILVEGGSLSVRPLMNDLRSANWRLKSNAQNVLIMLGEPAVDALIAELNHPEPYTRSIIIEALSKIGDKRAIQAINQKLDDPSKLVQVTAAASLYAMGDKSHSKTIIDALDDTSSEVRNIAAKATLEYLENPPLAPLLKLATDPDPSTRNYAILAIGKTRNPEAIHSLVKILKEDTDENVQSSAAKALESIGSPAVEPLTELLKSTDMELIVRVAQVLGNIGDSRAVAPLEAVYKKDNRPLVKNEVAKALNKID